MRCYPVHSLFPPSSQSLAHSPSFSFFHPPPAHPHTIFTFPLLHGMLVAACGAQTNDQDRATAQMDTASFALAFIDYPHLITTSFHVPSFSSLPIYCMCTLERGESPTPGVPGAPPSVFCARLIPPPHSLTRPHVYHAWHWTRPYRTTVHRRRRTSAGSLVSPHPSCLSLAHTGRLFSVHVAVAVIVPLPHLTSVLIIRRPLHIPQSAHTTKEGGW